MKAHYIRSIFTILKLTSEKNRKLVDDLYKLSLNELAVAHKEVYYHYKARV